jgi:pyruvate dehydrogenase E2 component (dihydrolipoyllysine-residue acetyltransferase)
VSDFKLPELGENIASGDVLRVLVNVGDTIARDQPVVELETDKATIEVPSSVAGQVTAVNVKAGDKVKVGQTLLSVSGEAPAPPPAAAAPAPEPREAAAPPSEPSPAPPAPIPSERPRPAAVPDKVVDISRGIRTPAEPAPAAQQPPAPAAPSVRRMARELGLDIHDVPGSGPDGRISIEDVKAHAKALISGTAPLVAAPGAAPVEPLPDFSRWGEIDPQPMRAVRRKTAEHLSYAWATIPHVTQHELADITNLEILRKRYAKEAEAAGGQLTVTAVAVKIVASALKVFPRFNSSIDVAGDRIIYKKYIHIGVAVDTDRGLLVPVIRDADAKNIMQIAVELHQLSEKARSRKIGVEEMQGGCFSISNLGGIGGTYFTPIVNAPEVAILGISRGRMAPVYQDGQFVARQMLPLSLSYDHRVIDGADAIRFLRWIVDAFEQPFLLALQG